MYLKIRIVDIEWDDHEYDDLSDEACRRFNALPEEVFVVMHWDSKKVPDNYDLESENTIDLCCKLKEKYGFDQYDWHVGEVLLYDDWPDGIPKNCEVYPVDPNVTEVPDAFDLAKRNKLADGDPKVPKVVFEIEQNGKTLELVRVLSTEHRCSDCLLSSGDYTACNVCKALSDWETRGGMYIFKEKDGV